MMKILSGTAVSSGIAIGEAIIKHKKKITIEREFIQSEDKKAEIEQFDKAVKLEVKELDRFIKKFTVTKEDRDLINTYKAILLDPLLSERIIALIDKKNYSAENALYNFYQELSNIFAKMSNEYLSERISDYEDVIFRLINRIKGQEEDFFNGEYTKDENRSLILVMETIAASDVTKSYHSNVSGICLHKGSRTSHSAIIARALGIPVVVGIPDLLSYIEDNDITIIDGNKGLVIISPAREVLKQYKTLLDEERETKTKLAELAQVPCQTKDGKRISLLSNIELEQEIDTVLRVNSDGIGLFRTEFLFVDREDLPPEDEQFEIYRSLAKKLGDKQLIIRTFDLGGDKLARTLQIAKETNPYLGSRGIRLSLSHPEIFITQIKAILRASHYGNVAMMFPMITSVDDMKKSLTLVSECKKSLKENKIPYNDSIKIGAMIEVPSAALCAEELAKISDFFSIGTNDLVQYTLAADRNNENISQYYDPYHPSIFKLIAMTVTAAHRFDRHVSVCGEIAAEPDFVCLLIALDTDSLSINPGSHLAIKKAVLDCDYAQSKIMLKKIYKMNSADEVRAIIYKSSEMTEKER